MNASPSHHHTPRLPGYPVVIRFPLHWGEMDALGHVNNTRFFAWMESARLAYFERLGVMTAGVTEDGTGPILAAAHCDFLKPVIYPAELLVGARVAEVGGSSLRMEYAVACQGAPDVLCARGTAVVVLVDYPTLAKVRVPDMVRAAIALLENGV
jgi:acyl-CoA thioester hydrolase